MDREPNDAFTEFVEIPYTHAPAALAATSVRKLRTMRRDFRIERVEYVNDVTIAADAANFWTLEVRKGATVMASFSTQTAAQGAITANTIVPFILAAAPAIHATFGDEISFALVKSASAANITGEGRLTIHGTYV